MHFGSSVVSITVSTGAVSVTRLAPASRSRAISSVGLMSRPSFLCHVWKSATAAAMRLCISLTLRWSLSAIQYFTVMAYSTSSGASAVTLSHSGRMVSSSR